MRPSAGAGSQVWIAGVVPDGISAVHVKNTSGPVVTALVSENVYAATAGPSQSADAPTTPACATHDLQITSAIDGGAAGTRLVALAYRNTTSYTCNMVGFTGVTIYGRQGRKLAVARREMHHQSIHVLQLKPGARAYSGISHGETPVRVDKRCPAVTSLKIYAPNSRQASRVRVDAGFYCGGALVRPLTTTAIGSLNN